MRMEISGEGEERGKLVSLPPCPVYFLGNVCVGPLHDSQARPARVVLSGRQVWSATREQQAWTPGYYFGGEETKVPQKEKHNKRPKEAYGDLRLASITDKKASDLAEFPS